MNRKYFFTQLSAPIVGIGVALFLLFVVGRLGILEISTSEDFELVIVSMVFLTVPVSMVIWGKLLVVFGVLSKGEAKGYPWSKPWKNKYR